MLFSGVRRTDKLVRVNGKMDRMKSGQSWKKTYQRVKIIQDWDLKTNVHRCSSSNLDPHPSPHFIHSNAALDKKHLCSLDTSVHTVTWCAALSLTSPSPYPAQLLSGPGKMTPGPGVTGHLQHWPHWCNQFQMVWRDTWPLTSLKCARSWVALIILCCTVHKEAVVSVGRGQRTSTSETLPVSLSYNRLTTLCGTLSSVVTSVWDDVKTWTAWSGGLLKYQLWLNQEMYQLIHGPNTCCQFYCSLQMRAASCVKSTENLNSWTLSYNSTF